MLCQVCKDGLESIGKLSRRCLEKEHTPFVKRHDGLTGERERLGFEKMKIQGRQSTSIQLFTVALPIWSMVLLSKIAFNL